MFYVDLFFLIFFVQCAHSLKTQIKRPTVRIKQGLLSGVKIYTDSGKVVDAYLGIPFAASPVGRLRFAPPQVHGGWNGTYQASSYGASCPQLPIRNDINEDENCLFLNIWTPAGAHEDSSLSVVVFFEGFEFAKGNRHPISGQDLVLEGIVIVNANYRLNVFGFLCFGNKEARGNMGLLDQYLTLTWVKENIKSFGGDSKKVTLFGYSAGAASAALHMISIRTADLFQKVIISSGSILSPWHSKNNVLKASQTIASSMGCLSTYVKSMLNCMRTKTTKHTLKAYEQYMVSNNFTDLFSPVVDNFLRQNDQYLPFNFEEALESGVSTQIPILVGLGRLVSDPIFATWDEIAEKGYDELKSFMELIIIPEIMEKYNLNRKVISDLLIWRYVNSSNNQIKSLKKLLHQLYFESKIEVPLFKLIKYFSTSHSSLMYVYYVDDYGLELNSSEYFTTSDLILFFGSSLLNQVGRRRFTYAENQLSERIKRSWINFINYGNPTPSYQTKIWPSYKSNENYIKYFTNKDDLEISRRDLERVENYYFWNDVLKNLAKENNLNGGLSSETIRNNMNPEYKHAIYTLTGLVLTLLFLLLICALLLKRRSNELQWELNANF